MQLRTSCESLRVGVRSCRRVVMVVEASCGLRARGERRARPPVLRTLSLFSLRSRHASSYSVGIQVCSKHGASESQSRARLKGETGSIMTTESTPPPPSSLCHSPLSAAVHSPALACASPSDSSLSTPLPHHTPQSGWTRPASSKPRSRRASRRQSSRSSRDRSTRPTPTLATSVRARVHFRHGHDGPLT